MIDFGTMTAAEASAYCLSYADGAPLRARWLLDEIEATSQLPRDEFTGIDGLVPTWAWFVDRLRTEQPDQLALATALPADDPQAGHQPPWHSGQTNPHLSDGVLWLIDALGCHLAVLAMDSCDDAHWAVYRSSNRLDFNQNRTRLFGVPGGPADPAQMVYGQVIGAVLHGNPWTETTLVELYDYLTQPL